MTRASAIAVMCVACAMLGGCGASAEHTLDSGSVTGAAGTASARSTSTNTGRRPHRPHHRRAPDPGRLPQTQALPSSHTRAFHAEMQDVWNAVLTDQTALARAAFFPETAYAQLKTIGDAAADWQYRLYADYRLDIAAAHRLLSPPYVSTHLVGVSVPSPYAHWVDPGVCENRVGYFEVPNARVVYRERGVVRSFGIASMISWRGRWYVIHLGYEGKLSIGGKVDAPSVGVGVSAPSGAC